ncbi:sulfite reductase [Alsobacter metallidurans]|uniref:assimilatory sulfite reductase (NADPH) n=1 Tax=Alsobacter metallidurans TaxID=340221 RepID=A0A917I4X2_9HYPH|nr:sulfite reductase subunit alpha [Alsobacter metallidurans]GGH13077.1 sulfite reductase [Alsobacter metallidurans]
MSITMPTTFATPVLPDSAPFSPEQRSWLNGFFAGLLSLDGAGVAALTPAEGASLLGGSPAAEDDDAPWHDQTLPIAERMSLAEGKPLPRRMMAAMAQQDCGQCGYVCETYAKALADGAEKRLNLCAPGGKETNRMLKKLAEELGDAPAATAPAVLAGAEAPAEEPRGYSRDAPAPAVFLSRRRLNQESSAKETHHIEFDLSRAGVAYEPGDAFGIYPNNPVALVKSIGRHLGIPLGEPITAQGQTRSLGDWLTHVKALSPAPDALFALLAQEAADAGEKAKLSRMAEGEGADGYDVLAALLAFPHLAPSPYRLIEALDPLAPRLYSISSSPRANPGRVSLTVDVVRYQVDERVRFGVASTFLGARVREGDPVRIYIQKAHAFGLPQDPTTPIIMVGPGTGIAPFRAFLQDRLVTRAKGEAWLFFGHQREASDFFYREELEEFQRKGALTRLSTAWSRDAGPKTYVQDRMREQGADLADWLDRGAHFYICGDATRMAKDVETALADILVAHRGQDEAAARAAIAALKAQGRYQADVY